MANEWCVAVEADTPDAAEAAADLLCGYKLEAESTGERVLCVADSRERAETLARRIAAILPVTPYPDELGEPQVQRWSEELQRYVDAEIAEIEEDDLDESGLESEIEWRVRVELEGLFARRRVSRDLALLGRPLLGSSLRHIDVGAWDEADALSVATQARDVRGVRDAVPSPLSE